MGGGGGGAGVAGVSLNTRRVRGANEQERCEEVVEEQG